MKIMPRIDIDAIKDLTPYERQLVERIVGTRGDGKGCLRVSKPPINYTVKTIDRYGLPYPIRVPDEIGGKAAYVWRMVAFYISPVGQHHCMPVMAEFDLPADTLDERRKMSEELDALVDRITDTIPPERWYGVARWKGLIG